MERFPAFDQRLLYACNQSALWVDGILLQAIENHIISPIYLLQLQTEAHQN
jgi:hypothetical protein